jgi:hypothetical protein
MTPTSFITDPEIAEFLADDAELLALADAVAATQPLPGTETTDAKHLVSRRRLIIAAAVFAVLLLIPLVAVATGNEWWFQNKADWGQLQPQPINNGQPTIIASGRSNGSVWTAFAYVWNGELPGFRARKGRAHHESLCMGLIVGSLGNQPSNLACGPLRGVTGILPPRLPADGWLASRQTSAPLLTIGAAAPGVTAVELLLGENNGGTHKTIRVALKSFPGIAGMRFFVLPTPYGGIAEIIALNATGKTIAELAP